MVFGFPAFYFSATNWRKLHSPYLYALFSHAFDNSDSYYAFDSIEAIREQLLGDNNPVGGNDLGTGSRGPVTISGIASNSLSSARHCAFRFRLVQFLKAEKILELGTSLGISASYLGVAAGPGQVWTLDGNGELLEIARLVAKKMERKNIHFVQGDFGETMEKVLEDMGTVDFAILDGNHRMDSTMEYFDLILPYLTDRAVVLVDDIRWSGGMFTAWKTLIDMPAVTASVDLYRYGLLFFSKDFREKQHYKLVSGTFTPLSTF